MYRKLPTYSKRDWSSRFRLQWNRSTCLCRSVEWMASIFCFWKLKLPNRMWNKIKQEKNPWHVVAVNNELVDSHEDARVSKQRSFGGSVSGTEILWHFRVLSSLSMACCPLKCSAFLFCGFLWVTGFRLRLTVRPKICCLLSILVTHILKWKPFCKLVCLFWLESCWRVPRKGKGTQAALCPSFQHQGIRAAAGRVLCRTKIMGEWKCQWLFSYAQGSLYDASLNLSFCTSKHIQNAS